jgi:hypothetical protein
MIVIQNTTTALDYILLYLPILRMFTITRVGLLIHTKMLFVFPYQSLVSYITCIVSLVFIVSSRLSLIYQDTFSPRLLSTMSQRYS